MAATFFVSASGSDSNPGTLTQPWATIQKAANTILAGDTVYVRGGTYRARVFITRSGNTSGYITFSNYAAEIPVIDGAGISITPSAGIIDIRNVSYINVNGFRVINSDDAAIYVRSSNHINLSNNSTNNSHSSGIGVWRSDQVIVDRNNIVNARNVDLPHGHEESISIADTTNFEVKNNEVSMQGVATVFLGNEAIDVKESSRNGKVHHNYVHGFANQGGAIYIDAWLAGLNGTLTLSGIEVYANKLDSAGAIVVGSEMGGTAENIKIYNNLVINGPATGIGISRTGYERAPNGNGLRRNIEIYNNTVYKARWNGGAGIYVISENIDNIIIKNNLISYNNWNGEIVAVSTSQLPKLTVDHNLVFGPKNCAYDFPGCVELSSLNNPAYPKIHSNLTADPQFVDVTTNNLHLKASSPAINAGTNLSTQGVLTDFEGITRPQGSAYDIGALEYSLNPPPLLGDFNADGEIDYLDGKQFIPFFGSSNNAYKLVTGTLVNIFDWNKLHTLIFR